MTCSQRSRFLSLVFEKGKMLLFYYLAKFEEQIMPAVGKVDFQATVCGVGSSKATCGWYQRSTAVLR